MPTESLTSERKKKKSWEAFVGHGNSACDASSLPHVFHKFFTFIATKKVDAALVAECAGPLQHGGIRGAKARTTKSRDVNTPTSDRFDLTEYRTGMR